MKLYRLHVRRLRSGVRQGGILSPTLFSIYVNDILIQLQASKTGCFVANKFVGALMYADDLLLVSITLTDMRVTIALVCEELKWLDMTVNVKKSAMIRVGPRFNAAIALKPVDEASIEKIAQSIDGLQAKALTFAESLPQQETTNAPSDDPALMPAPELSPTAAPMHGFLDHQAEAISDPDTPKISAIPTLPDNE